MWTSGVRGATGGCRDPRKTRTSTLLTDSWLAHEPEALPGLQHCPGDLVALVVVEVSMLQRRHAERHELGVERRFRPRLVQHRQQRLEVGQVVNLVSTDPTGRTIDEHPVVAGSFRKRRVRRSRALSLGQQVLGAGEQVLVLLPAAKLVGQQSVRHVGEREELAQVRSSRLLSLSQESRLSRIPLRTAARN